MHTYNTFTIFLSVSISACFCCETLLKGNGGNVTASQRKPNRLSLVLFLIQCFASNKAVVPSTMSLCREPTPNFSPPKQKRALLKSIISARTFFCFPNLWRKRKCYLWRTNLTQLRSGEAWGLGLGVNWGCWLANQAHGQPVSQPERQEGRQEESLSQTVISQPGNRPMNNCLFSSIY